MPFSCVSECAPQPDQLPQYRSGCSISTVTLSLAANERRRFSITYWSVNLHVKRSRVATKRSALVVVAIHPPVEPDYYDKGNPTDSNYSGDRGWISGQTWQKMEIGDAIKRVPTFSCDKSHYEMIRRQEMMKDENERKKEKKMHA